MPDAKPQLVYTRTRGPRNGVSAAIYWDGWRKSMNGDDDKLIAFDLAEEERAMSLHELIERHPLPPHLYPVP